MQHQTQPPYERGEGYSAKTWKLLIAACKDYKLKLYFVNQLKKLAILYTC